MYQPRPQPQPPQTPSPPRPLSDVLPRRAFLRLAAATTTLAATGSLLDDLDLLTPVTAADVPPSTGGGIDEHQWAFVIDLRRCDGCGKCTKGCQEMHHLPEDQEWIKVHELTDASGGTYNLPVLCQMCERAPCVQVCPVGATYHLADGPVIVDQNVCIGCRMCMAACPYGVRTFNWGPPPDVPAAERSDNVIFQVPQRQGTVGKCDSCAHAMRDGELPACVESCPMGAIFAGDFMSDAATNGEETISLSDLLRSNDAYRLKEELGTEPRVYYVAGHGQQVEY